MLKGILKIKIRDKTTSAPPLGLENLQKKTSLFL
jgi:hypothetical protein